MNEMLRRFGFTVYAPDDGSGDGDGDGGAGDDAGGDGGGDGGSGGDGGGSGNGGRKFTQAELNAAARKDRTRGRNAALQEVAETLGMSVEEAKEFIEKKRADDDSTLSEAEKKLKAAEDRDRKAAEREARAARREREATAVAALAAEGVKFERDDDGNLVGKGAKLVKLVTADLDDDADAGVIAAAVDELKVDTPELFTSASGSSGDGDGSGGNGGDGSGDGDGDGEQRRPPSGDLGRPKNSGPPTSDDLDRGKARAAKVNERNKPFDPFATASGTSS